MTEDAAIYGEDEASAQAAPALSDDGIGITLQEAINLLAMKNGLVIGKDDPILMLVTLHNAFLSEHVKLFDKHKAALQGLMSAETANFITKADEITGSIQRVTSSTVVEQAKEQLERLTKTRRDMLWLSLVMLLSASANIAALFFAMRQP